MKFKVQSSNWYTDQVLEKYPCLKNYSPEWIPDTSGQSHYEGYVVITINTLEELCKLATECDEPLIIFREFDLVEIYDGYRE